MSRYEMVQCPFDPNHKVCGARFQYHVVRCKANHPEMAKLQKVCPYNARHRVQFEEFEHHVANCPDKNILLMEKVKGRPVSEIVNKGHFGMVREPRNHDADPIDDDWFPSEPEEENQSPNDTINSFLDKSDVESASSAFMSDSREVQVPLGVGGINLDRSITGSSVSSQEIGFDKPIAIGIGRCNGRKLDNRKAFGRAAFRHQFE